MSDQIHYDSVENVPGFVSEGYYIPSVSNLLCIANWFIKPLHYMASMAQDDYRIVYKNSKLYREKRYVHTMSETEVVAPAYKSAYNINYEHKYLYFYEKLKLDQVTELSPIGEEHHAVTGPIGANFYAIGTKDDPIIGFYVQDVDTTDGAYLTDNGERVTDSKWHFYTILQVSGIKQNDVLLKNVQEAFGVNAKTKLDFKEGVFLHGHSGQIKVKSVCYSGLTSKAITLTLPSLTGE